jgi:hypothetical protein
MLAENSGTKSAAAVLTELSAAHKEENGKFIGYNIDAEQSLTTDLVLMLPYCLGLLHSPFSQALLPSIHPPTKWSSV